MLSRGDGKTLDQMEGDEGQGLAALLLLMISILRALGAMLMSLMEGCSVSSSCSHVVLQRYDLPVATSDSVSIGNVICGIR
jgi:uracil phosphoribosyltransferase